MTLPSFIQDVGNSAAITGAFLAAPDVVMEWVRRTVAAARWVRARLPWWRPPPPETVAVGRNVTLKGGGTLTAHGRVSVVRNSLEARMEQLEQRFEHLAAGVRAVDEGLLREQQAREVAIEKLRAALHEKTAAIREEISERDRKTLRVNARGLPVAGFGIVLSGFPDALAHYPALGVVSVVFLLRYTARAT